MAIARFKPDDPVPVLPNLPVIEPPEYKGIIVDNKQTPLTTLLAYVEGSPWTVNYYSQLVAKHNDLREHDVDQPNIYQQYTKILNLELRVNSPLTESTDTETATITVTGAATIYPGLIPNVSDYFVAATGNGRDGIFRINNVERKSFNRQSVFSVDYDLVAFVDDSQLRYDDLNAKVVHEYYFHKERLVQGLTANVLLAEHNAIDELKLIYQELIIYYMKTFFNLEYSTLIIPGQQYNIYDSFLVKYLLKTLQSTDAPEIRSIRNLNTERDQNLAQPQLWSVLLERDNNDLKYCNKKMGVYSTLGFSHSAVLNSIKYSRLDYLVYPLEPDFSVNGTTIAPFKLAIESPLVEASSVNGYLDDLIGNKYLIDNNEVPYIHPVLIDTYYVLSSAFYNKDRVTINNNSFVDSLTPSLLELLTIDYLELKAINIIHLLNLCQQYRHWGRLEQFYYIPLLLTLIKASDVAI